MKKRGPNDFDCVAFKHAAQARIYEEIKDLSHEEEIAYFRRAAETGSLAGEWKRLFGERQPVSAKDQADTLAK
jgi:hypothetical protein